MQCEKCNGGGFCICPFTLGLSLGLTCAILVFLWSAYVLCFGMPEMIEGMTYMKTAETWGQAGMMSVFSLIKGFIFGFVFALVFNLIKRCKSSCCGKCSCCSPNSSNKR